MNRLTRLTLVALWSAIVFGSLAASVPSVAVAQDTQAELETMLQQATDDYDVLMLGDARQKLNDAITLAEQEGASGTVVADLYVMLGIVEFAEARDKDSARQSFVRALEHDYHVNMPPHYKNPSLEEAMDQARRQVPQPAGDSTTGTGPSPTNAQFEHKPPTSAQSGEALELEASIPADMPVYRVFIHHRRFGEDEFAKLEMEATSATRFATELAPNQVNTSQIEYYIEVVDRAGSVIAQAGTPPSPLAVTVLGSSNSEPDVVGTNENPADDDDDATSEHKVYFMLTGGSGIGFLPGGNPTAHPERSVSAGAAPAFGHGMLEAGYMLTENAHLGLYARWQFSPQQDFAQLPTESTGGSSFLNTKDECLGMGPPGDCLLGVKYRWFFKDISRFRMYSSTGAGIGRVRHWLRLEEPYYDGDGQTPSAECDGKDRVEDPEAGTICYVRDTVRPGWAHFGVGAGAAWPVHENVELAADGYLIVLMPEVGVNFDMNLGMNFRF